ncbi:MAG: nuclear transport factor 2 family protein [Gammaproteobacteria bacterium]
MIRDLTRTAFCICILLPLTALGENAIEQEVWNTVQAYSSASKERDLDKYLSYWHPDFLGWYRSMEHPTNHEQRHKMLAHYFATTTAKDYELIPLGIVIQGNTAVVHYEIRQTLIDLEDNETPALSRWTDVLVNTENGWLLLSDHGGDFIEEQGP